MRFLKFALFSNNNRMKYLLNILLVMLICPSIMYGQSKRKEKVSFYNFKNEIGINFTNVLGNVLSLNPNNANSPYGLSYRRHFSNYSFRSALNLKYNKSSNDDFENGDFVNRVLDEKLTEFRVGLERHIILDTRVLFSFGIDILGLINIENSEINKLQGTGSLQFISKENNIGAGIGPFLRLEYKISDRIFISSESSLYGFYSKKKTKFQIAGMAQEESESTNSSLILQLPQSIFFNISF